MKSFFRFVARLVTFCTTAALAAPFSIMMFYIGSSIAHQQSPNFQDETFITALTTSAVMACPFIITLIAMALSYEKAKPSPAATNFTTAPTRMPQICFEFPSYEESETAVENDVASDLEKFINEYEDTDDENWRDMFMDAIQDVIYRKLEIT